MKIFMLGKLFTIRTRIKRQRNSILFIIQRIFKAGILFLMLLSLSSFRIPRGYRLSPSSPLSWLSSNSKSIGVRRQNRCIHFQKFLSFPSNRQRQYFSSTSSSNSNHLLSETNKHPLDSLIQFDPITHAYQYQGRPAHTSVTQLVGQYFQSFDQEEAARQMMNGRNWPRDDYLHPNGEPFTFPEIIAKWNDISLLARYEGTLMHETIEKILNNIPYDPESIKSIQKEADQFQSFYQEVIVKEGIIPYRTEWKIAAPNIALAGSVDFVGELPANGEGNKTFILMDWKRTKKAPAFFSFKSIEANQMTPPSASSPSTVFLKKARPPLSSLYDCDEVKYSLQLNLYNYILTNYYDLKIAKMMIVALHPQLPHYYHFDVPDLQRDIHSMICDYISSPQFREYRNVHPFIPSSTSKAIEDSKEILNKKKRDSKTT